MYDFAVIIPDRGDRPALTNFCLHQISQLTIQPAKVFHVNYKPKSDAFDLIPRIRKGIELAKKEGIEKVYILENDDKYPADYIEKMPFGDADIIGCESTIYYNLQNNTWQRMSHYGRSSLFTTALNIKILKDFNWPADNYLNLDVAIWKHAVRNHSFKFIPHTGAIGIKHGIGKCGGMGHKATLKNSDPDREWLKDNISSEAYIFYQSL